MSLAALLRKEVLVVRRSRLLMIVLILYPLLLVGIIGYAFSQPNQKVPLAVVNEDVEPATGRPNVGVVRSPIQGDVSTFEISSADIIESLRPFADLRFTDAEEGRRLLLTGEVLAVVRFPPNFVRDIASLQTNGEVNVTIDQSDPVRAKFMEVLIRGVVQEFQEDIVQAKVDLVVQAINRSLRTDLSSGDQLYPGFRGVRERLVSLRDGHADLTPDERAKLEESIRFIDRIIETLESSREIVNSVAVPVRITLQQERSGSLFIRDLVVPAALGLSIFWTGSLATSSLLVYERESPAYTRLRITPATALSIYGSKVVLTLVIVLGQSLFILGAALLAWHTRIDNFGLTLATILLSSLASIGLGVFLAGLSRDVNGTVLLSVLVTFPMLFLAGLFYPVEFMPAGAQTLARAFPLTYTVGTLRGAMLRGFSFDVAAPQLVALLLFGFLFAAAGFALGRRLEQRR